MAAGPRQPHGHGVLVLVLGKVGSVSMGALTPWWRGQGRASVVFACMGGALYMLVRVTVASARWRRA